MAVLRELAQDITRATGVNELSVEPMARSGSNMTMLLRGEGQVFFAKIFTDADVNAADANLRYDREKQILSKRWPVPMPVMVYSADTERVIVTREVQGHGFKHFIEQGRVMDALGMMARWVAGFHAAVGTQKRDETLWDHFGQYDEMEGNPAYAVLRDLLSQVPLTEYVLTKGDVSAHNFKFNDKGAVGLDFESVGYRAKEFDLIGMIRGLHKLTGESISAMSDTVVQQYDTVRRIDDIETTAAAVAVLTELTDY
ncbi:hypothetical protein [Psychromarinibacter sp. S121]|uniref:hypothetical protein n=1 Tax=Psychromarinibacter sp. S121 TaxID=3415127 RepID=UPI003C797165